MFTMEPPPALSMWGIAARIPRHTPERLTSSTSRQSSSDISPAEPAIATAALLTMPSSRPWCSIAASTSAWMSSDERTSVRRNEAFRPSWSATCRPPSSSMSPRTTIAPSPASASADARPIPVAAPVTATTFSSTRPAIAASSGATELRRAFLDERPDAFVGVGGLAKLRKCCLLVVEPMLKVGVPGDSDELGHRSCGEGRDLRDRIGLGERGVEETFRRDDLCDEAERMRLLGGQPTGGKQHVVRHERPDGAGEPLGPAPAGAQPEQPFGQREDRGRRRDQHVAAQRDLEPAAERVAVDRADHGCPERVDASEHVAAPVLVLDESDVIELGVLADVGAGDERPVAGAGDDDDANIPIALRLVERCVELFEHRRAERVQLLGTVQREDKRRVPPVTEHEVGHTAPSSRIAAISSAENPIDASTSSVCWPTDGGPERTVPGVPEKRTGMPTTRIGSPSGRSTVVSRSLCATCGSSTTSSKGDTGAHHTSRVASKDNQLPASRSSNRAWIMR